MMSALKYNKEIELENSISEIESISLECSYNEDTRGAKGVFILEGAYSTIDDVLENFRFELPFEEEINNLKNNTLNIEVKDFTYEIDGNKLIVNIEYDMNYEQEIKEELDMEEFNEFIQNHEVEIVDFKEKKEENKEEEREIILESIEEEDSKESIQDALLESISNEDRYITYHVHLCESDDTLESISKKYNISINDIIDYNNTNEISAGMKLILPVKDE